MIKISCLIGALLLAGGVQADELTIRSPNLSDAQMSGLRGTADASDDLTELMEEMSETRGDATRAAFNGDERDERRAFNAEERAELAAFKQELKQDRAEARALPKGPERQNALAELRAERRTFNMQEHLERQQFNMDEHAERVAFHQSH